jgi:hypothetical protein
VFSVRVRAPMATATVRGKAKRMENFILKKNECFLGNYNTILCMSIEKSFGV